MNCTRCSGLMIPTYERENDGYDLPAFKCINCGNYIHLPVSPAELAGGEPMLLKTIGEDLGLTRQRIQQIEKIALWKLECALKKEEMTAQDIEPHSRPIIAPIRRQYMGDFELM